MPDRDSFITTCDSKLRLVRTEADLTQEQMAHAIGISKKTLVDIEKGRRSLGWSGSVALCVVFSRSNVISSAFGESPVDMIPGLALTDTPAPAASPTTNPWWEVVADNGEYRIEQNVVSQHYRLMARDNTKIAASFDIDDLIPLFQSPTKES